MAGSHSTKVGLAEWFTAEYRAAVGLDRAEGGARFRRLAEAFPAGRPEGRPITGQIRMGSFLRLRLGRPLGAGGYWCAALEAELAPGAAGPPEGPRQATHYAYAYWRREQGAAAGAPEYICVAPTFDSRDGEYRRSFVGGPVFLEAYERKAAALAPVEGRVLALLAAGRLRLGVRPFPEGDGAGVSVREAAEAGRLPVLTFVAAVALGLTDAVSGALEGHASPAHRAFMAALVREEPELASAARRLEAEESPLILAWARGRPSHLAVRCGQKLVPLFLREAMQVGDPSLAAWRELAVARLAGDLALNFISPGFAHYNQWTLVAGAGPGLFETEAMAERYARARAVDRSVRALRKARRRAIAAPPNAHTAALAAQVYDSLDYARSFLQASPQALLHTMEDVGWTLGSLAARIRRDPAPPWPALADAFATPDAAARHLFELAYAAHCLHAKLGVAHTDLHADNMTLYLWGLDPLWRPGAASAAPSYAAPVVAFVAGARGEADTFVFPAAGDSACLIDFSRAILGPAFGARLEAEGHGRQAVANLFRDQVGRVLRTLHRYAPEFVAAHEAPLRAAALARFGDVFPVLCAVDFLAIGRAVSGVLAAAAAAAALRDPRDVRPFAVAPEGAELARRLEEAGRELLGAGLQRLVSAAEGDLSRGGGRGRPRPKPAGAPPQPSKAAALALPALPGEALLRKLFDPWRFPVWAAREPQRARSAELVDAYSTQNELRWEGGDYAKWPPWARLDAIESHLGGYKVADLFERGFEPFLEALAAPAEGAGAEAAAAALRAAQEALDGGPAAATSWLDE